MLADTETPAAKFFFALQPGEKLEYIHRFCPRCGIDLADEPYEADGDQGQPEQIKSDSDRADATRMPADLEPPIGAFPQRMVAPLTQAEKECAKRNEQRWLSGQKREQAGSTKQEYSQASRHEHLIPMLKRKLCEWIRHFFPFF